MSKAFDLQSCGVPNCVMLREVADHLMARSPPPVALDTVPTISPASLIALANVQVDCVEEGGRRGSSVRLRLRVS
jgi:hypothetical protein